jgi:hypothetical protein
VLDNVHGAVCIDFTLKANSSLMPDGVYYHEEKDANNFVKEKHLATNDAVQYSKAELGTPASLSTSRLNVDRGFRNGTAHSIWIAWNTTTGGPMSIYVDAVLRNQSNEYHGIGNLDTYQYLGNSKTVNEGLDIYYQYLRICGGLCCTYTGDADRVLDVFNQSAPANSLIYVETTGCQVAGPDTNVCLYQGSTSVTTNNDGNIGVPLCSRIPTPSGYYTLAAGGKYQVKVSGNADLSCDDTSKVLLNSFGIYTVKICGIGFSPNCVPEPQDCNEYCQSVCEKQLKGYQYCGTCNKDACTCT